MKCWVLGLKHLNFGRRSPVPKSSQKEARLEMRGWRRSEDHLLHLPPALASFPKLLRPGNIAPPLAGVAPASLAWASGHFSLLCWSSAAWIRASPSESPEIDSASCWGAGGTVHSRLVQPWWSSTRLSQTPSHIATTQWRGVRIHADGIALLFSG